MTERLRPSPERLHTLLDYDPNTGRLTWKRRTGKYDGPFNRWFAGGPAGTLRTDGYIAVKVQNAIYAAHQIIWAMVHGEWPECVRHRNRINSDNRLANLHAVTREELQREVSAERAAAMDAMRMDCDGRRYRLARLTAPNKDRPELTYEFLGVHATWRWSRERMLAALEAGLIVQSKPGRPPRLKRYVASGVIAPKATVRSPVPGLAH